MDWISRGARSRVRAYSDTVDRLSGALGRKPSEDEVAEALGVEVTEVRATREDAQRRTVSFDEEPLLCENIGSKADGPEEQLLQSEQIRYVNAAVDALPTKLRTVIVALYRNDTPVKELAEHLGVTQSRISQLRTQALDMIRDAVNASLSPELAVVGEQDPGVAMRRRLAYYAEVAECAATRARQVDAAAVSAARQASSIAAPVFRSYTVREHRPEAGDIDIDFVAHGDQGVAGPWAQAAQPGHQVAILDQGCGFDPIDDADFYLLAGDESGTVVIGPKAYLGVIVEADDSSAVIVSDVQPDTPAARTGLAAGDTILSLDGQRVRTRSELSDVLDTVEPDSTVTITWTTASGHERSADITPKASPLN